MKYAGSELELFRDVHYWKAYWASQIRPFIRGDVLEVGAGIGANTALLDSGGEQRWVCLEPDPELTSEMVSNLNGRSCQIICGTTREIDAAQRFDTILYIDVLEHIEKDAEELNFASGLLRSGGRIVVLAPAHQFLFSNFDASIGHFRRYNKSMLRSIALKGLRLEKVRYLDSFGLLLSAANAWILGQSMPTASQLQFWDRCVVPVSRVFDRLFGYSLGKTVIGIWRKT